MGIVGLVLTVAGLGVLVFVAFWVARLLSLICLIVGGALGLPLRGLPVLGRLEVFDKAADWLLVPGSIIGLAFLARRGIPIAVPDQAAIVAVILLALGALASIAGGIGIENNRSRGYTAPH